MAEHRFVDYGATLTTPPPYVCEQATLYGWVLRGKADKLEALCRSVFTEPSGGAVDYRPVTDRVLLTFGDIGRITSKVKKFADRGYSCEQQVALWMLVGRVNANTQAVESVAWFLPFLWVDSHLSLAGGREVLGFAKDWGRIELPNPDDPRRFMLEAFGGNFERNSKACRYSLLEVNRAHDDEGNLAGEWESLAAAFEGAQGLLQPGGGGFVLPKVKFEKASLEDHLRAGVPQICLRQFRSAAGGPEALCQEIVEVPSTEVVDLRISPLRGSYELKINKLQSHPIGEVLGLAASQDDLTGYRVTMNFDLGPGKVVWQSLGGGHAAVSPPSRDAKPPTPEPPPRDRKALLSA